MSMHTYPTQRDYELVIDYADDVRFTDFESIRYDRRGNERAFCHTLERGNRRYISGSTDLYDKWVSDPASVRSTSVYSPRYDCTFHALSPDEDMPEDSAQIFVNIATGDVYQSFVYKDGYSYKSGPVYADHGNGTSNIEELVTGEACPETVDAEIERILKQ